MWNGLGVLLQSLIGFRNKMKRRGGGGLYGNFVSANEGVENKAYRYGKGILYTVHCALNTRCCAVLCCAVLWCAVHCWSMQYSTVHCRAMQYSTVQYGKFQESESVYLVYYLNPVWPRQLIGLFFIYNMSWELLNSWYRD